MLAATPAPVAQAVLQPVIPAVLPSLAASAPFMQAPLAAPPGTPHLLAAQPAGQAVHTWLISLAPGVLQQPVVCLSPSPAGECSLTVATDSPAAVPASAVPLPAAAAGQPAHMDSWQRQPDDMSLFDWLPPLESLEDLEGLEPDWGTLD